MHKFYAFILSFLLVGTSTLGSYAQATIGNAAVDTVIRVQRGIFATVATGLAASALVGIKAKELYDDNKQAVYDKALDAYDAMSENAKASWSAAVARGKTGGDLVGEVWDSITSVISDVFSSHKQTIPSSYYTVQHFYGYKAYFTASSGTVFKLTSNTSSNPAYTSNIDMGLSFSTILFNGSNVFTYPSLNLSDSEKSYYMNFFNTVTDISSSFAMIQKLITMSGSSAVYTLDIVDSSSHNLLYSIGSPAVDPIYDQSLKRALDTDIPRMRDAGMVLPEVDVRTPSGTRVNYDAQAGTVTLPDGSTYDGDLIAGNIPDAVVNGDDVSWHDTKTNTDTNIWDGSVTDSITGDTVTDVGENAGTAEGEAGAVDAGDLPAETDIENVPSRGIVWTPLVQSAQDLTERFPFSIPWDLQRMLSIFNTDPQTPKFDIDIDKYVEIDGKTMGMKWTLDFGFLDPLAAVGRWFLIIVFDIAMILGIRKIMPE